MNPEKFFTPDDLFILSSACSAAISLGDGEKVRSIMTFLQSELPTNAQGFVLEALHLYGQNRCDDALAVLKDSGSLVADVGRDEAMALNVVLLRAAGREDEAVTLGQSLLTDGQLRSEPAQFMVASVLEKVQAADAVAAR